MIDVVEAIEKAPPSVQPEALARFEQFAAQGA